MYTTESVLASTQSQKHDTNLGANVEPREVLRDPLLPYGEHLERTIEFRALGVLLLTSHHTNHEGPKHGRRKGEDNPVEAGDPEAANVKRQPPVHSNVLQHIGLDSVVHDGLRMLLLGIHRDYREVHVRRHRANDETSSANIPLGPSTLYLLSNRGADRGVLIVPITLTRVLFLLSFYEPCSGQPVLVPNHNASLRCKHNFTRSCLFGPQG